MLIYVWLPWWNWGEVNYFMNPILTSIFQAGGRTGGECTLTNNFIMVYYVSNIRGRNCIYILDTAPEPFNLQFGDELGLSSLLT